MLAVCKGESTVDSIADNSKTNTNSNQNQPFTNTKALLRTKEVENFNNYYSRRPFESLNNRDNFDRVVQKNTHVTSIERLHKGASFANTTDCQGNIAAAVGNGCTEPLAKRFAIDQISVSKTLSENRTSLSYSINAPAAQNSCSSSTFLHHAALRDSCNFGQQNFGSNSALLETGKRKDLSHNDSSKCNLASSFSTKKGIPGDNQGSLNSLRKVPFCGENATNSVTNTSALQQRWSPRSSPLMNNETKGFPKQVNRTNSPLCNQSVGNMSFSLNKDMIGNKAPETPQMRRTLEVTGLSTPCTHQTITPAVGKTDARTPFSGKTPQARKFPGPAGLLPKLVTKIKRFNSNWVNVIAHF